LEERTKVRATELFMMKSSETILENRKQGYLHMIVTFTKTKKRNPQSFDGEGKQKTKKQR